MSRGARVLALLAGVAALAPATLAHAHQPSDAYLTLEVEGSRVTGRWDLAVTDLEQVVELDADHDGRITWAELHARRDAIAAHAFARVAFTCDDGAAAPIADPGGLEVVEHASGYHAVLRFSFACARAPHALTVDYHLFFDVDAGHRGLLRVDEAGRTHTAVLGLDAHEQRVPLERVSAWRELRAFAGEGVWHIWIGIDHILFLLALLLPVVVDGRSRRAVLVDVLRVVTAFTVAHSVTLVLAALGLVQLPTRLVETAIAVSVALAALNNLYPVVPARWTVAFALGLLHGFGFSSVLVDLGLPRAALAAALLGFNLGVELGQAAIVALFLPVAFVLRGTRAYRVLVWGGSAAIVTVAVIWSFERFLA